MRKCNDEIYQLAKDQPHQALVQKLKNKRFRPFCLCLPGVMFVTRGSKNSVFFVFDFLSTLDCQFVVNDINFGSAKVIQWVPRRHKVLTHGKERLFRPADLTVKEVNHIRYLAIDIAKYLILLSCCLPSWKENQRQKRESFWIRELQTLHPEGINKKA